MVAGPQESRLNRAVAGADRWNLFLAETEWRDRADRLDYVANALDKAAPVMVSHSGGDTGTTAQEAFRKVAQKSRARAAQMRTASEAIGRARDALVRAEGVQKELAGNPQGDRPSFTPSPPGVNDVEDVKRYRAHTDQLNAYNAAAAERQARARAAADHMDEAYGRSTDDLESRPGDLTPQRVRPRGGELPVVLGPTAPGAGGTAPSGVTPIGSTCTDGQPLLNVHTGPGPRAPCPCPCPSTPHLALPRVRHRWRRAPAPRPPPPPRPRARPVRGTSAAWPAPWEAG